MHIARDVVTNYYPTTVGVNVALGEREAVLTSTVVCKGYVNDPTKGASAYPITYLWELGVVTGGANAAILSPTSPTTKLRVLNPMDTLVVTLTVTTRYDVAKTSVTISVP
jgi:hypothetical protein